MRCVHHGGGPDRRAQRLATRVLAHARRQQWGPAAALLQRIGDMGPRAQLTLVYGMADAVGDAYQRVAGPPPDGAIIGPAWIDDSHDRVVTDADSLPAAVRWVGRFVSARTCGDCEMCEALIGSIADEREWSAAVSCLVEMSALTVNRLLGEPR